MNHAAKLYIIDYGLAKKFVYDDTGEHIENNPLKKAPFVGSLRYCSLNVMNGGA